MPANFAPRARLVLTLWLTAALAHAADSPPNILFMLVDDLGYGDLGKFYQNVRAAEGDRNAPWFATPKLDLLASEGIALTRHYCPAPVCAPSRASLLLGVHQGHANVRDNQFDKELENNHTLGTVLKQAGYRTAVIGKWGLQGPGVALAQPGHPLKRGFDDFYGMLAHLSGHYHYPRETPATDNQGQPTGVHHDYTNVTASLAKCYTTDLWTARAKWWLTDHRLSRPGQPFFLYLAYDTPHARLQVPTQAYPPGNGTNGGVQWVGDFGAMINTANGTIDSWIHPDYAGATWDHDRNPATPEQPWPAYAQRHATMVRRLDDALADVLQTLTDLGLHTNTLVIFTSDNGPHNEAGAGGTHTYNPTFFDSFAFLDGIKRDCWEGGLRVPTIVRWPLRIAPGRESSQPSAFWDWMPTFAEVAGVPAPARTDGVSLLPTLTGQGARRPGLVYVEYNVSGTTPTYTEFEPTHRGRSRGQMQVIHLSGYKGVRYNATSASTPFEIYDVLQDPSEATNLASNPLVAPLQQQMQDRVLQVRRPNSSAVRPYDTTPVPPVAETGFSPGLQCHLFEGQFAWVPDATTLAATTNSVCSGLDPSVFGQGPATAVLYAGYLDVPVEGRYTFFLQTDGRAFLRLHDAGLIDADFGYVGGTERSGSAYLKAGHHPIRLSYVRGTAPEPLLSLHWSGPEIAKQAIPPERLQHAAGSTSTGPRAMNDRARTPRGMPVTLGVLANDLDDGQPEPLHIIDLTTPLAGTAQAISPAEITYTPKAGFLGEDYFSYKVSDGSQSATARVSVKVYYEDGRLWFPFNQTSGWETEDAGGALTAVLLGFVDEHSSWRAGKFNQALQFDGGDDQVVVSGYPGITGSADRTVAAWIQTTAVNAPILCWGTKATGQKWIFLVHSTGQARVEIEGGYVVGTKRVNDGTWHHVAAVFRDDGSPNVTDVRLYVDGEPDALSSSLPVSLNTTTLGDVQIGADLQGRFFTGLLDEVRLEQRAATAADIAAWIHEPHPSAAAWHRRYFGEDPVHWEADDDADGGSRLLEYALGGQPLIPDDPMLAVVPLLRNDRFEIHFPRRLPETTELTYTPEASLDLVTWREATGLWADAAPSTDRPGFEQITYEFEPSPPSTASFFARLRMSLP